MNEAGQVFSLDQLKTDPTVTRLEERNRSASLFSKNPDKFVVPLMIIAALGLLLRSVLSFEKLFFYYFAIYILVGLLFFKMNSIRGIYQITEKGLVIPYTWFTQKHISWKEITKVENILLKDLENDKPLYAVQLELDTNLTKFNTSGLKNPDLTITEKDYDKEMLESFYKELQNKMASYANTPDTLAERLSNLVDRSWFGRKKLLLINLVDTLTETLLYLLLIDLVVMGLFGSSIFPVFGMILLALVFFLTLLLQFGSLPQAIVGMRPHELGPLMYYEAELISDVRIIVKSYPHSIEITDCEMIYAEDAIKQVEKVKDIQPDEINPGKLQYVIIQMRGNHTKAKGAIISFKYPEIKDNTKYEIEILWA